MRIKYTGPGAREGSIIEVDEAEARRLLERDDYEKAAPEVPRGRGAAARAHDGVESR